MARTDAQNEQMRETRKEKIRQAALMQFSQKGLFATRIEDIAKGANMSQGLLYHYYPSKEAIYIDLVGNALEKMSEAAAYVRDMDASANEKILFALRELFQTIQTSDHFRQTSRLISQAASATEILPEEQAMLDEKRERPYATMAEVFRAGQAEGSVVAGDPHALAILFFVSVNGLCVYYAARKEPYTLPDYRLLAALFLKNTHTKETSEEVSQ